LFSKVYTNNLPGGFVREPLPGCPPLGLPGEPPYKHTQRNF
jgi:hypothetical protein